MTKAPPSRANPAIQFSPDSHSLGQLQRFKKDGLPDSIGPFWRNRFALIVLGRRFHLLHRSRSCAQQSAAPFDALLSVALRLARPSSEWRSGNFVLWLFFSSVRLVVQIFSTGFFLSCKGGQHLFPYECLGNELGLNGGMAPSRTTSFP